MTTIERATKIIDATPSPGLLMVLENVDLDLWQCLAELIDNPLDDFAASGNPNGRIDISLEDGWLKVKDNGTGMDIAQLEKSLRAGYSDKNKYDSFGLYGIGFNASTAVLGRTSFVKTKVSGASSWLKVAMDLNDMKTKDSFDLEVHEEPTDDLESSGTEVWVLLKKEHLAALQNKGRVKVISNALGHAYSYILRENVPGLSAPFSGALRDIEIHLMGDRVLPYVPCIWSEDRSVIRSSEEIKAVQTFDFSLPPVAVCNSCGVWHQNDLVTVCTCKSEDLVVRERNIWGWIGVQRYIDENQFGIDFIRNGRTIMPLDKQIFGYADTNTGESGTDYPIEMPANRGRIVGEVHCDHVRVNYLKTAFDNTDPAWVGVREVIRGHSSMRTMKSAAGDTIKPLPKIFRGFRRNDPGLNYLVPGDGKKAIHAQTKNWAVKFRQGEADFQSDDKWYDTCVSHDTPKVTTAKDPEDVKPKGPVGGIPSGTGKTPTPVVPETIQEKMDRWKMGGTKREDLSITVTPKSIKQPFQVEVWVTTVKLDSDNEKNVAVHAEPIQGSEIHVFVNRNHTILSNYGRSVIDMVLMELAVKIRTLSNSNASVSTIYAELLSNFPDEEKSEGVLKSRISGLTVLLGKRIREQASGDPSLWYMDLNEMQKTKAEGDALAIKPTLVWADAKASGEFVEFLDLDGLTSLVHAHPEEVMDGKVFKPIYATAHAVLAKERSHGYVTDALKKINQINKMSVKLNDYERNVLDVTLEYLDETIVRED